MAAVAWLLDCEPRSVQLEALRRSHLHGPARGYCYFMQMRLGKTNVALNEYLLLKRDHGVTKLLVLAPFSYKGAWASEARTFGLDEEVHVFESAKRTLAQAFVNAGGRVLVLHYESLISEETRKLLAGFVDEHTLFVADESVRIKNRNSQFFKHALDLAKDAGYTRCLTGKPVVQGPQDLWSQLRFARQLDGVNFFHFRNKYCLMGGFKGKQIVGVKNEVELDAVLQKCAFVAKRRDWGTNFDSDYVLREVGPMLPAQKKAYDEMEEDFITWLEDDTEISADQAITKYQKLQQIASGFVIDAERQPHTLVATEKLPKFRDMYETLVEQVEGKAIVVVFYKHSILTLTDLLREFQPAVIFGSPTMKLLGRSVEEEKERFTIDPKCRILIGQIQAIKYGHNLMGSLDDPCLTTFYYENTYSLDDRAQSEERNQGEGQQAAITIIDYHCCDAELRIVKALQKKESLSEAILKPYLKE